MTWNYRLLRTEHDGEVSFAVHEVYYDEHGAPNGATAEPAEVYGETFAEAIACLVRVGEAFAKPPLELDSDGKLVATAFPDA